MDELVRTCEVKWPFELHSLGNVLACSYLLAEISRIRTNQLILLT